MKKHFTLSNLLFLAAMVFLTITTLPSVLSNFGKEGELLTSREHLILEANKSDKTLVFPVAPRSVAIFWATWCAPCKLEMNRLSKSVKEGEIPRGAIVAINPFESKETIVSFLRENSFPFTFIEDKGLSQQLNVNRTPTTLFIENNKVLSVSSGLSLIGIWRAESFL